MSNDESSLLSFLDFVLSRNRVETSIRIPKSTLLESLREYAVKSQMSDEPTLVFEDWEPLMRKPFFIGNHLIYYSIYTDTLTIELVPTLHLMDRAAETYTANLKASVVKTISDLTFREFERLMKEVFRKVPWIEKVNLTRLTHDEGIDFEGTYLDSKSGLRMNLFGQAKHWDSKVGSETIRTFIGSISVKSKSPSIGIFVSKSGYTDDAQAAIQKSPIKLLAYDVEGLAELMIDYGIGVKTFRIEGKTIDEPFWKEIKE